MKLGATSMGEGSNEYHIQGAGFSDQLLEITFYESRDISPQVKTIKTQLIDPVLYSDEIASILEDLGDLLDRSFVHRRLAHD